MVTGMAIASPTTTMGTEQGRRAGGHAVPAANDTRRPVLVIDRDIGGVLAAEYRSLITYSRRLTSNGPEAADLVHIVCARVLAQQTPIAGVENLSGWLRTVLFHTFIDLRRRAKWEIPTDSAALDQPTTPPEAEPPGPSVTIDEIRALLLAVPAHYRVPYELFTFEDMPYARIATVLGLSCTTVGTRINRARERLRRLILLRYGGQ
jgi:RNA polymerase sigma-70 factor (ECF subfamily)